MHKVANDISTENMKEVFKSCRETDYKSRQQNIFRRPLVNPVYNSTERVSF